MKEKAILTICIYSGCASMHDAIAAGIGITNALEFTEFFILSGNA